MSTLVCTVVLLGSVIAIATDLRKFKVYNALTVPMLVGGILYHTITNGWSGLLLSIAGLSLGFLVLFVPYLLGAMGAGDVKLLAAIGAWVGASPTVSILIVSLLLTACYSVILLIVQGRIYDIFGSLRLAHAQVKAVREGTFEPGFRDTVDPAVGKQNRRRRLIPFSVMVGIAAVVTLGMQMSG